MMRLTAYVSGRVQRVGYLAKIISLAHNPGLVGLVQNLSDGLVLVIAEGDKGAVEKFASAINKGLALVNLGKYDEAIRLDPKFALAWNNKGEALASFGKTTEANAALEKAKELGYYG